MFESFKATNVDVLRMRAFRDAAVADGWTLEIYYETESTDRAFRLRRDGFLISGIAREPSEPRLNHCASLSCWGPDGLAINGPVEYPGFEFFQKGLRTCNNCNATDVTTERYSFAGRCCETCLPKMRKQHEYAGWTN